MSPTASQPLLYDIRKVLQKGANVIVLSPTVEQHLRRLDVAEEASFLSDTGVRPYLEGNRSF